MFIEYIVPQPGVDVTLSHTAPLYAGTSLTLTCTVRVDPNVDNGERIMTKWSGLQDIPEERYSVTGASGSGSTYTGSLTISPLANQDDGTYTCTVTATGGNNMQQATASDNLTITVMGKCTIDYCIPDHVLYPFHSSPCTNSVHISCQWIPYCWAELLPHMLCEGSATSGGGAQH